MDYSDLYQRVKHDSYAPTRAEMKRMLQHLSSSESIHDATSSVVIDIFCQFSAPTVQNRALLDRFLTMRANDYARASALENIVVCWNLSDERYRTYIIMALRGMNLEEYYYTATSAFRSALHMSKSTHDLELNDEILLAFVVLVTKAKVEEYFYRGFLETVSNFICIDARKVGNRIPLSFSWQEAIESSPLLVEHLKSRI